MPAETRARVRRAASRSFLRHGYHTSVDEIARRAGVAKQTLYHHFPSKDELFKEVACDLAKRVLVGLEAEAVDVSTGLLRLGLAYRRRGRFGRKVGKVLWHTRGMAALKG